MTGLEFIDQKKVDELRQYADKDINDIPELYKWIAQSCGCNTVCEIIAECEDYLCKKYANIRELQKNIKK